MPFIVHTACRTRYVSTINVSSLDPGVYSIIGHKHTFSLYNLSSCTFAFSYLLLAIYIYSSVLHKCTFMTKLTTTVATATPDCGGTHDMLLAVYEVMLQVPLLLTLTMISSSLTTVILSPCIDTHINSHKVIKYCLYKQSVSKYNTVEAFCSPLTVFKIHQ